MQRLVIEWGYIILVIIELLGIHPCWAGRMLTAATLALSATFILPIALTRLMVENLLEFVVSQSWGRRKVNDKWCLKSLYS